MKIAIMQPYFMPYIGYFQLINAVDEFIIYDNIEYTKKGWINRNRIMTNGSESYISLPLRKDSDFLHVRDRYLADNWETERKKILNRIVESYRKAPYFKDTYNILEMCLLHENKNLFCFIYNSINTIVNYLNIETKFTISSSLTIDHSLKSEDKVIAICREKKAKVYINPSGGTQLYNSEQFAKNGIHLRFIKPNTIVYSQFSHDFIPWLSIIDLLMFNSTDKVNQFLEQCEIITPQ